VYKRQYKDYQTLANFLVNEIGFDKKFVINSFKNNSSDKENNNEENNTDNSSTNAPAETKQSKSNEVKNSESNLTNTQEKNSDKATQENNYSTLNYLKKQNYTDNQKKLIARELQELMLKGKK
jgi:hypothetical protein